jgi:tetratricopeptide (TPR) repeat protein
MHCISKEKILTVLLLITCYNNLVFAISFDNQSTITDAANSMELNKTIMKNIIDLKIDSVSPPSPAQDLTKKKLVYVELIHEVPPLTVGDRPLSNITGTELYSSLDLTADNPLNVGEEVPSEKRASAKELLYQGNDYYNQSLRESSTSDRISLLEKALKRYEDALILVPKSSPLWSYKGDALVGLAKYLQAIQAYSEAIRISPMFEEAWNNKAFALQKLDRYEEAQYALNYSKNLKAEREQKMNKNTLIRL